MLAVDSVSTNFAQITDGGEGNHQWNGHRPSRRRSTRIRARRGRAKRELCPSLESSRRGYLRWRLTAVKSRTIPRLGTRVLAFLALMTATSCTFSPALSTPLRSAPEDATPDVADAGALLTASAAIATEPAAGLPMNPLGGDIGQEDIRKAAAGPEAPSRLGQETPHQLPQEDTVARYPSPGTQPTPDSAEWMGYRISVLQNNSIKVDPGLTSTESLARQIFLDTMKKEEAARRRREVARKLKSRLLWMPLRSMLNRMKMRRRRLQNLENGMYRRYFGSTAATAWIIGLGGLQGLLTAIALPFRLVAASLRGITSLYCKDGTRASDVKLQLRKTEQKRAEAFKEAQWSEELQQRKTSRLVQAVTRQLLTSRDYRSLVTVDASSDCPPRYVNFLERVYDVFETRIKTSRELQAIAGGYAATGLLSRLNRLSVYFLRNRESIRAILFSAFLAALKESGYHGAENTPRAIYAANVLTVYFRAREGEAKGWTIFLERFLRVHKELLSLTSISKISSNFAAYIVGIHYDAVVAFQRTTDYSVLRKLAQQHMRIFRDLQEYPLLRQFIAEIFSTTLEYLAYHPQKGRLLPTEQLQKLCSKASGVSHRDPAYANKGLHVRINPLLPYFVYVYVREGEIAEANPYRCVSEEAIDSLVGGPNIYVHAFTKQVQGRQFLLQTRRVVRAERTETGAPTTAGEGEEGGGTQATESPQQPTGEAEAAQQAEAGSDAATDEVPVSEVGEVKTKPGPATRPAAEPFIPPLSIFDFRRVEGGLLMQPVAEPEEAIQSLISSFTQTALEHLPEQLLQGHARNVLWRHGYSGLSIGPLKQSEKMLTYSAWATRLRKDLVVVPTCVLARRLERYGDQQLQNPMAADWEASIGNSMLVEGVRRLELEECGFELLPSRNTGRWSRWRRKRGRRSVQQSLGSQTLPGDNAAAAPGTDQGAEGVELLPLQEAMQQARLSGGSIGGRQPVKELVLRAFLGELHGLRSGANSGSRTNPLLAENALKAYLELKLLDVLEQSGVVIAESFLQQEGTEEAAAAAAEHLSMRAQREESIPDVAATDDPFLVGDEEAEAAEEVDEERKIARKRSGAIQPTESRSWRRYLILDCPETRSRHLASGESAAGGVAAAVSWAAETVECNVERFSRAEGFRFAASHELVIRACEAVKMIPKKYLRQQGIRYMRMVLNEFHLIALKGVTPSSLVCSAPPLPGRRGLFFRRLFPRTARKDSSSPAVDYATEVLSFRGGTDGRDRQAITSFFISICQRALDSLENNTFFPFMLKMLLTSTTPLFVVKSNLVFRVVPDSLQVQLDKELVAAVTGKAQDEASQLENLRRPVFDYFRVKLVGVRHRDPFDCFSGSREPVVDVSAWYSFYQTGVTPPTASVLVHASSPVFGIQTSVPTAHGVETHQCIYPFSGAAVQQEPRLLLLQIAKETLSGWLENGAPRYLFNRLYEDADVAASAFDTAAMQSSTTPLGTGGPPVGEHLPIMRTERLSAILRDLLQVQRNPQLLQATKNYYGRKIAIFRDPAETLRRVTLQQQKIDSSTGERLLPFQSVSVPYFLWKLAVGEWPTLSDDAFRLHHLPLYMRQWASPASSLPLVYMAPFPMLHQEEVMRKGGLMQQGLLSQLHEEPGALWLAFTTSIAACLRSESLSASCAANTLLTASLFANISAVGVAVLLAAKAPFAIKVLKASIYVQVLLAIHNVVIGAVVCYLSSGSQLQARAGERSRYYRPHQ